MVRVSSGVIAHRIFIQLRAVDASEPTRFLIHSKPLNHINNSYRVSVRVTVISKGSNSEIN